jgi:serine/threonine-protein kinase
MLNRTLDNRYTILEHIGGGGMAAVYRAHDELLDRSVAVKILRSQFTNDDEFVTRFRREAQAAARLSHPNIVNVYDVGQDKEVYYIVMEYVSGKTLKEWITNGPLSVEAAVKIALEIAEALEHAHQNNLVHCDIKPHNILMTKAGRIKVTDFGIARAVSSATMTHTGTIMGSVHYFSPEQAKGAAIDAKSDIYSLGVVMYEMLTGEVPFTGENPISIALKHLQEEPRSPRGINPEIPPLLEAIVLKAMAKDVDLRYKDIGEMIADLKSVQNYFRDDQTRRLAKGDFPTQALPRLDETAYLRTGDVPSMKPTEAAVGKPKKSRLWLWSLLVLLLMGFALGAFLSYGKFWSSRDVTVPNVVGQPVEAAKNILENQNLRVLVTESVSDSVPAGRVISQTPDAGSVVKEQRLITLLVSKGQESVVIPDFRGMNRRDAELQIKNAGLVLGNEEERYSADVPLDTVISQNPRSPAQVAKNTPVDLVISKGPEPNKVALPDFKGASFATISAQLNSMKLKLGKVSEENSDQFPAGTVIGQNPPPATQVAEGTAVDLTVVKGADNAKRKALVQITVPDGPPRQAVKIVVTDNNGSRVVYENMHKPGDKIEKTVTGTGQLHLQVYINGALVQEQTI